MYARLLRLNIFSKFFNVILLLIYFEFLRNWLTIQQVGDLGKILTVLGLAKVLSAAPLAQTYARFNHLNTIDYNIEKLTILFIWNCSLASIFVFFANKFFETGLNILFCLMLVIAICLISLQKTFFLINLKKFRHLVVSNVEDIFFRFFLPIALILTSFEINEIFIATLAAISIFLFVFTQNKTNFFRIFIKLVTTKILFKFPERNDQFNILKNTIITSLGSMTISYFDRFFVEFRLGTASLAVLFLFITLQNLILTGFSVFVGTLQNSEFLNKGNLSKAFYLITTAFFCIILIVLNIQWNKFGYFLDLVGGNFGDNLTSLQFCWAISSAIVLLNCNLYSIYFYKRNKSNILSLVWGLGALVNVVSNFILFEYLGLDGVFLSTLLSFLVILFSLIFFMINSNEK